MNIIEKYFRAKADQIAFIELKDNIKLYEKNGLKDIPLPIILDEMLDGFQNDNFQKEVSIEYIVNGILYLIAIDSEFLYANEYKNILKRLLENPSKYALSKAVENMENDERYEKALIYSRAAFLLDEKNELAAYNYSKFLWNLDIKDKEERQIYVEQSVRILERILNYNKNNVLANFELGNICVAMGDYIKANNFYKNSLKNSENEEINEQIRIIMKKIEPDVAVADSIYYINKMDYGKALELLMKARRNSSRYDISYYIAIAYMNQQNAELSEKFFEEAIDKGADFATLYTDLVYIKYILRKDIEALHIANNAIEKYPSEIKLRYNRAIILIELNKLDKANEDLDFILEYQDLSDEMFNQIMKIKEKII